MAFYHRTENKKQQADFRRQEEEVIGSLCRLGGGVDVEHEKRIRREIANSNERRRMQSINAGFQALRALLPTHHDKLSKAAILQSTADYVYKLEQEKTRLLEQNSQLSRRMHNSHINHDSDGSFDSPLPKRKKLETADSVDEGIGSASPTRSENDDAKHEIVQLRIQLEHERSLRLLLEEELKNMESQLFNSGANINHIHVKYEDTGKTSIILGNESGLGSPQSQVSSQESNHEFSLRESSSPELSITEIPEDLSGKNNSMLLPCVGELSISDVSALPGLLLATSTMGIAPAFPIEIDTQQTYKVKTSKQNLEAIVEAIRHVEGDHMFRDDPMSPKSEICESTEQDKLSVTDEHFKEQTQKQVHALTSTGFSFQHQIIRNAPLTQSRPGVIVSNLS